MSDTTGTGSADAIGRLAGSIQSRRAALDRLAHDVDRALQTVGARLEDNATRQQETIERTAATARMFDDVQAMRRMLAAPAGEPTEPAAEDDGDAEPWEPVRRYMPGNADPYLAQQRGREQQEKQKREANRPTGTELGQITRKLDELTQELKRQQEELARQQAELAKQQAQLEAQQEQLKTAQEQLKIQQASLEAQQKQLGQIVDQLKGIVDDQGSTVNQLKTITDNLAATDGRVDQIQRTLYDNQVWLKDQLSTLDQRVTALENKGTVTG